MVTHSLKPSLDFEYKEHNPQDGFWGETRQKVLHNLSVLDSIALQDSLFGFSGPDDRNADFFHGMAHACFEALCVHDAEYAHFLPNKDPKTGFLKPFGYNGFMNGEFYVVAIEKLLRSWDKDFELSKKMAVRAGSDFIRAQTYHHRRLKLDNDAWHLADLNDTPISIFGVKKNHGWCGISIGKSLKEKLGALPRVRDGFETNRYGEVNPITEPQTSEEILRLLEKLERLFEGIKKITAEAGHENSFYSPQKIWEVIPIRSIHDLVAGSQSAKLYFDYCENPKTICDYTAPGTLNISTKKAAMNATL